MKKILKDTLALFLITLISGVLLGFVYKITKEPIKEQELKTKLAAYQTVFSELDTTKEADEDTLNKAQTAVYDADFSGVVIQEVVMAYDKSGNYLGMIITVKDSNGYGESIARLSNMLGGGVILQRFGDLIRGQRSTVKRVEESFVTPTLAATPGDLSLVMPKRILDGIIEMIYALDKIAPGTANDDTLLYGVEVKFYNMEVELDKDLQTCHQGLYVIGDGSGVTHSLSHASASGVYVARRLSDTL